LLANWSVDGVPLSRLRTRFSGRVTKQLRLAHPSPDRLSWTGGMYCEEPMAGQFARIKIEIAFITLDSSFWVQAQAEMIALGGRWGRRLSYPTR
jgi:hypothetical protein